LDKPNYANLYLIAFMLSSQPTTDNVDPAHDQAKPVSLKPTTEDTTSPLPLEPTRYGDWEKNGRCIDF
jgi:hypothetical protein